MKCCRIVSLMCWSVVFSMCGHAYAQGIQPYPEAITDRLLHPKTPMPPPPVRTVFTDPDFGSSMVRVTNRRTDSTRLGSFFHNPHASANAWSADGGKFYLMREDELDLAFGFDQTTMQVSSLPGARPNQGFRIPLQPGPTFSSVDPDLMFGTLPKAPLTIASYRFSTGKTSVLLDTTTCGTRPALAPNVTSDALMTASADDSRVVISEGARQYGSHMFVTVYDKVLGCRWYNTQTGDVGGQWGALGQASVGKSYSIRHTSISGSGRYVKIESDGAGGFYVWDVETLNVTLCPLRKGLLCDGYAALGYDTQINAAGSIDEMNTLKRPLGNLADFTQLVVPLPLPHYWGMEKRFTWSNGSLNDDAPVCGNTYSYDGDRSITQPYDGEIFCIETDGLQSTIWRFGHNRSVWESGWWYTAPFGSVSLDGRFLMFTSSWDNQVGTTPNGGPRTDVWIVKLH
jgi:hypothetical protein